MRIRQIARTLRRRKIAQAQSVLRSKTDGYIASGPFQGLRYITDSINSAWSPKVIGTYEKELWSIVEEIIDKSYKLIIDIGAAEGYYAVGFAYRMQETKVICFESEPNAHLLLQNFAKLNTVDDQIEVFGACTPEVLSEIIYSDQRTVIICDIEGAEYTLLDPKKVPGLKNTDILVELHHFVCPDIAHIFYERFSETHRIELIQTNPRNYQDFPRCLTISKKYAMACMDEDRPCSMMWFWMKTKEVLVN